jgi:hypothetical protein
MLIIIKYMYIGGNDESRSRGICYVLASLTPNHRDILALLATIQIDQPNKYPHGNITPYYNIYNTTHTRAYAL